MFFVGAMTNISKTGVQRGLHVLEGEPECLGVECSIANVHKKQSILYGMSAQELDFAGTQGASSVKIQRQRPIHFLVRRPCSCISIVQDILKETD